MKKLILPVLPCLFFVWIFPSCNKTGPIPANPNPLGTMVVNLNFPAAPDSLSKNYELIISEPSGKILLDTLSPLNTPVKASLSTNASLVDVTTVYLQTAYRTYTAFTYKGVDPTKWVNAIAGSYDIPFPNPYPSHTTPAQIYYINAPILGNIPTSTMLPIFNNYALYTGAGFTYPFTTGKIGIGYNRYAGNYAYLLLPSLGLYNLHIPKGDLDTADLSHIDTAVKVKFAVNSGYSVVQTSLNGIFDTTDFSRSIDFFPTYTKVNGADLAYPHVPVQKYELTVEATAPNQGGAKFYSYDNKIPASITFPDESSYTLSNNQSDNFTVKFTGAAPTDYATRWNNGKVYWTIYASPDSTTLHPSTMFAALKPRMMQGQDLSSLTLKLFSFETVSGFTYPLYLAHVCNPASVKSNRVTTALSFYKSF